MKQFHGRNKKSSYFEGWYLKHQSGEDTVCFIPAFHVDERGERSASLQVIVNEKTGFMEYPASRFYASESGFYCHIGNSRFSINGIEVDFECEGMRVKGKIEYSQVKPPKKDIMGPFAAVPFMQCYHGILSMSHELKGELDINGRTVNFDGGRGYIEKDRGTSFPSAYTWLQCSWGERAGHSLMLAVAEIPLPGFAGHPAAGRLCKDSQITKSPGTFTGIIFSALIGGEEYRIATYKGARIIKNDGNEIWIRQKDLLLKVRMYETSGQSSKETAGRGKGRGIALRAPRWGRMSQFIMERPRCRVRCRLTSSGKPVFDMTSEKASAERRERGNLR